jgi:hypothetical protein
MSFWDFVYYYILMRILYASVGIIVSIVIFAVVLAVYDWVDRR